MMKRAQRFILGGLEANRFRPVIDRAFKLRDIREAHAYMDANRASGKLVVTVE